jgi:hypothetical protein
MEDEQLALQYIDPPDSTVELPQLSVLVSPSSQTSEPSTVPLPQTAGQVPQS